MMIRAVCCLLALLCASLPAAAAPEPRIGLVLSGGGARGLAHIGVLRVLEELHVPVHAITATSMGSIVGGAYASGLGVDEMQARVLKIDWNDLFQDDPPREQRPMRRRQDDRRPLVNATLGYGGGQFKLPKGAVNGQKLGIFLRQLVSNAEDIERFDALPVPFRAVATDLVNGQMKVFDRGDLALAMRASMSVPSAFAPVEIDNHLYVDGGLTRNLPVDIARQMGVDVIIAVNLGTPLLPREDLQSLLGVTVQMISILTEQNVQASLGQLDKRRDVLVLPQLDGISSADFSKAREAIAAGEAATRAAAAQLRRYSIAPERWTAWSAARTQHRPPITQIDEVVVEGLERVNPAVARDVLNPPKGAGVGREELERHVGELYGYGDFERIDYRVRREGGKDLAIVDAVEKSWGPTYLRFGLGLSSEANGDATYGLRASALTTWINPLGAEWRTDLLFGSTQSVGTEFYQPLVPGGAYYLAPWAEFRNRDMSIFVNDDRVARYRVKTLTAGLDFGMTLGDRAELRFGAYRGTTRDDVDVGLTLFPEVSRDDGGLRLRLAYDTLDSLDFPHQGSRGLFEVTDSLGSFGAEQDYLRTQLDWTTAWTFGKGTLLATFSYGDTVSGRLPFDEQFVLGGIGRLSGYRTEQLRGERMLFGRLAYLQRLGEVARMPYYFGGTLEYGRMWQNARQESILDQGQDHSSASLMFGIDSFLGPAFLSYGIGDDGQQNVYLLLGRPW
ncbi:MAG TPA: patatin-like phospholipase family protein [Plasticicumulans sp.]|uniref:patatin-like phospholipase family protein n=2 Tax=Plasticicumulans sp. TaxID=2307179 RepID=UPI002C8B7C98|nr:patatin-like phospholipase family protein [Plasticicumulans sp.]HMW41210.1 patatin-like phospholipase family protein [Plasticicumulans sp.]HMZ09613.1 patatin-like phospholipase family protein [Plasticicumulans sp.]HNF65466.1 patatin-like phospholipase family protein [Plasticicumulans sp.]HNG49642.1 patatin-like phospholipase family protein [Plasticicumulans sp.]